MTAVASLFKVNKNYGNILALQEVDFSMSPGEVRALLGKNGAGKSTLIRMLSGAETPDSGEVRISGQILGSEGVEGARRLGVRTVYQELSLIESMSVSENMFMGHWPSKNGKLDYITMHQQTEQALLSLGLKIEPKREISSLSIADRQLVEIARALRGQPQLLILDEPTSSLAAAEVERVLATVTAIRGAGVAVIYVSHRLNEIRRIADRVSVMRDGQLISTRIMAEVDTQDIVRMMVGDLIEEPKLKPSVRRSSDVLVDVFGVHLNPHLHGVNLQLHQGEVLGIAGVLGSGRTELLNVIAGLITPDSGRVSLQGNPSTGRGFRNALRSGLGITPEDRKELGIFPGLGVDENMVSADWSKVSFLGVLNLGEIEKQAKNLIERLKIKVQFSRTEIDTLSGGNQQKAIIGRWLHFDSRILLLDEPTRGVDVEAKAQIYRLIRILVDQGRSVIFVSSELEELPLVCDRVVILRNGRIAAEYFAPNLNVDEILAGAIAGT